MEILKAKVKSFKRVQTHHNAEQKMYYGKTITVMRIPITIYMQISAPKRWEWSEKDFISLKKGKSK